MGFILIQFVSFYTYLERSYKPALAWDPEGGWRADDSRGYAFFSEKPYFFFCGQFHVKLAKNGGFILRLLGSKVKLAVV